MSRTAPWQYAASVPVAPGRTIGHTRRLRVAALAAVVEAALSTIGVLAGPRIAPRRAVPRDDVVPRHERGAGEREAATHAQGR